MQFGVQFFPDPPRAEIGDYFREALILAEEADRLGFGHIRWRRCGCLPAR